MNQEKIGKFILELRKQKGMTQKELAQKIGVSDKTISKWECGNSMPDISYLESLCSSLEISVNELLSGECLSKESYSEKAEENIMALMKENEINKKGKIAQLLLGITLGCMGFIVLLFAAGEYWNMSLWTCYVDAVSLLALGLTSTAIVLLSEKRTKEEILLLLKKVVIPDGVLISLFQFVLLLRRLDTPASLGPNLAVCILVVFYAIITYLVATIILERLKKNG